MPERLCEHKGCACEPDPGERFCAPSCEERESARTDTGDQECRCGHPECRPENTTPLEATPT